MVLSLSRETDIGASVFGISSDPPEDNNSWAQANNLPFPLLTDNSSILRKTFGIKVPYLSWMSLHALQCQLQLKSAGPCTSLH
jgi:peroxiredoxin